MPTVLHHSVVGPVAGAEGRGAVQPHYRLHYTHLALHQLRLTCKVGLASAPGVKGGLCASLCQGLCYHLLYEVSFNWLLVTRSNKLLAHCCPRSDNSQVTPSSQFTAYLNALKKKDAQFDITRLLFTAQCVLYSCRSYSDQCSSTQCKAMSRRHAQRPLLRRSACK